MFNNKELVWVVSFSLSADGEFTDYEVDVFDLQACSDRVARHLKEQMDKGVFRSEEEAEHWARMQLSQCSGHGCGGTGGKKCGCLKK